MENFVMEIYCMLSYNLRRRRRRRCCFCFVFVDIGDDTDVK